MAPFRMILTAATFSTAILPGAALADDDDFPRYFHRGGIERLLLPGWTAGPIAAGAGMTTTAGPSAIAPGATMTTTAPGAAAVVVATMMTTTTMTTIDGFSD